MLVSALLIMALIAGHSDTPLGRALRRMAGSVRVPRITLGRTLIVAGLLGIVVGAALLWKGDGLMLSVPMLPDGLAWVAMFDFATYADVIAVMAIVAATVRLRAVWAAVRSAIKRWVGLILSMRRRASERTTRPRRSRPKKPSADDEGRWGMAWSA